MLRPLEAPLQGAIGGRPWPGLGSLQGEPLSPGSSSVVLHGWCWTVPKGWRLPEAGILCNNHFPRPGGLSGSGPVLGGLQKTAGPTVADAPWSWTPQSPHWLLRHQMPRGSRIRTTDDSDGWTDTSAWLGRGCQARAGPAWFWEVGGKGAGPAGGGRTRRNGAMGSGG